MDCKLYLFLLCLISVIAVESAIIEDYDVEEQGLYSKSDHVIILTRGNFERKVYGQKQAMMVQFYNTYCGHCRAFAPKFKSAAADILAWKNIVRLAVLDCSEEDNNELCREFEVMAYPSLRYFHENYHKGNKNFGDTLVAPDTEQKFKNMLVKKLLSEQSSGRLGFAPPLSIASYASYSDALTDVPQNNAYTILVLENDNSTVGLQIALDLSEYKDVRVKRVYDTSELANAAHITHFPSVIAMNSNLEAFPLAPSNPTKENLLNAINSFLSMKTYTFPKDEQKKNTVTINANTINSKDKSTSSSSDITYYSDLEKTIKTSLHTEIPRHKILTGEPLQSLLDYLDALVIAFPYQRGNLRDFVLDLRNSVAAKHQWTGSDLIDLVKRLETAHAPVYTTELEYIGCRGSQTKYRGYSCGLWTLFHTMTVNAAEKPGLEGPKVLKAMHGYIKNFFGCTDCSQHFQDMAARNRIFDVKDNDKAVLWLWISHNEVNLRLAGDVTEDPDYPKIQYPSIAKCPDCRLARGAWNLPAVYDYLQMVYGESNIQNTRTTNIGVASPSFSNLDIGMLSLLLHLRAWVVGMLLN